MTEPAPQTQPTPQTQPAPTPRNVSAEQFDGLSKQVEALTALMTSLAGNQQPTPAPQQPVEPKPTQPTEPAKPETLGGLTAEQIKALVDQNAEFKTQQRTNTLNSLAKEAGVTLDDNLTKMVLANNETDDGLKAAVESLAKLEGVQKSGNPTNSGFKPSGGANQGSTDLSFTSILNSQFGKHSNPKED
jgi:hypothetical protein